MLPGQRCFLQMFFAIFLRQFITNQEKTSQLLRNERFPRASNYEAKWLTEEPCGANPLWLAEWLCEDLELKPGMRVL